MPLEVPALTGRWVRLATPRGPAPPPGGWGGLEPLSEPHREPLRAAADDERIWRHTITVARGPGFDEWFDEAMKFQAAGSRVPFAVRRWADDALIGSTSYLDVVLKHKRLEIGSTWYRPEV